MKQDGTDKSRAASEELNELRAEARTLQHLNTEARTRKRVLGIHELTSRAPLVQLSAKPWTNITDNDEFVSEVVSLYLTWWHPIWRPFETKYFVEACRAGDLKSPFCSPFLFHAVVSIGSVSLAITRPKSLLYTEPDSCHAIQLGPPMTRTTRASKVGGSTQRPDESGSRRRWASHRF